jgi:c-di-GMP-binding flagellar brake protein YcgR
MLDADNVASQTPSGIERRRATRFQVELGGCAFVVGKGTPFSFVTADISTGGVCYRATDGPENGDELFVYLATYPTEKPLEFSGKVVWSNRGASGVVGGISFTNIDRQMQERLSQFINNAIVKSALDQEDEEEEAAAS